ncbi:hypothetical protein [Allorhizocola rhizosphaerae]|uniref:hypothetical protein n=1 Tax=Allorhizocola rhizosphaerae TaxID=1872709 RepID=UPI001B8C27F1|nr:hypothetical protein [Allorhizocola rhizosphaerae]
MNRFLRRCALLIAPLLVMVAMATPAQAAIYDTPGVTTGSCSYNGMTLTVQFSWDADGYVTKYRYKVSGAGSSGTHNLTPWQVGPLPGTNLGSVIWQRAEVDWNQGMTEGTWYAHYPHPNSGATVGWHRYLGQWRYYTVSLTINFHSTTNTTWDCRAAANAGEWYFN